MGFNQFQHNRLQKWTTSLILFSFTIMMAACPVRAENAPVQPAPQTTALSPSGSAASVTSDVHLSGTVSRVLQNLTGITPLTGFMASRSLTRQLRKKLKGQLTARLHLFSASDLGHGYIRQISIQGEHLLYDNMLPISRLSMISDKTTPLYITQKRPNHLIQPVTFHVESVLSQDDLNRFLANPKGQEKLTNLKVKMPPLGTQHVDLLKPDLVFDGDHLQAKALVNLHGSSVDNAVPIELSGKLVPNNNKIALSDIHLKIQGVDNTSEFSHFIESYFGNIINLNKVRLKGHTVNAKVTDCHIENGQLTVKTTMTVQPAQ